MNISANVQFYVVTHVSHTNQIVYINSYSTHPYQAIKISLFTTPQWPHILGQKCMHRQCRPRLNKGLHYLPYRPYFKPTCYSPCLQHHNDWTYQPYLYGLSCEFAYQYTYLLPSSHLGIFVTTGCSSRRQYVTAVRLDIFFIYVA